jgi:hypothetical protein
MCGSTFRICEWATWCCNCVRRTVRKSRWRIDGAATAAAMRARSSTTPQPAASAWPHRRSQPRFRGATTRGTWTLIIADAAGGVVGRVNSASLEFNTPSDSTTRRASIDPAMRPDAIVTSWLVGETLPIATVPSNRPELRAETRQLLGLEPPRSAAAVKGKHSPGDMTAEPQTSTKRPPTLAANHEHWGTLSAELAAQ